jgi:hypothetical protein
LTAHIARDHLTREATGKNIMKIKTILQSCIVSVWMVSPVFAQDAADIRGYWAGGYTDGQGGEIQFEMIVIEDVGQLKYDTNNWGPWVSLSVNTSFPSRMAWLVNLPETAVQGLAIAWQSHRSRRQGLVQKS